MSHTVDAFQQSLTFPLDPFQLDAVYKIDNGESVVVCAPTGSGKTIIAEFSVNKAFERGMKVFYTTPLKALSNQKYFDFKARFGEDNVGLLTGDQSVNRNAQVVVMTTEVFRNMLYGVNEDSSLLPDVGYVVLDECHFMNDAERGTVWEESIIYCPRHIQIIALSATIANAQELTEWIDEVHNKTALIETDFRPVPLRFSYFTRDQLFPLFESQQGQQGRQGQQSAKGEADKAGGAKPDSEKGSSPGNRKKSKVIQVNPRLKGKGGKTSHAKAEGEVTFRLNRQLREERSGNRPKRKDRDKRYDYQTLLARMHERDMLPAIVFIFSRKGCDEAMNSTRRVQLINDFERRQLRREIDAFVAQYPVVANHPILNHLANGFAAHHAGLLPAVKLLVEQLFQQGLIKAVFATETLAAGINMPARSTVITAISKRTDDGHRLLTASEFLQMSGRAGRRGMDEVGYVVITKSPYNSAMEAGRLASSPSDPLNSQFTPTYGMVSNLLQTHTLEQAQFLISKSFGQYTSQRRLKPLADEIQQKEARLQDAVNFTCPYEVSDKDFEIYQNNQDHLYAQNKHLGQMRKQIKRYGPTPELIEEVRRLQQRRDQLEDKQQATACSTCKEYKKHVAIQGKTEKLDKRLKVLRYEYEREKDRYWQQFLNIYNLLKSQHFIDEEDRPNPFGVLVSRIRTENEYFVTRIILEECLDGLSPSALAGVICALITDSNRDNIWSRYRISPDVQMALEQIHRVAGRTRRLQNKHAVEVPVNLNPIASGLIEAWADGMDWSELVASTNLGEGDLVRMIRRTSDLLRQLSRVEDVPMVVAETARMALSRIYRDPIQEVDMLAATRDGDTGSTSSVPEPPSAENAPSGDWQGIPGFKPGMSLDDLPTTEDHPLE